MTTTDTRAGAANGLAARAAVIAVIGLPVGLFGYSSWAVLVGTATLEAEGDIVQGWRGVVYQLPAALLWLLVHTVAVHFAARAQRTSRGHERIAYWTALAALFACWVMIITDMINVQMGADARNPALWALPGAVIGTAVLTVIAWRPPDERISPW